MAEKKSGGGAGAGGGEVDVPADMATMFIMDLMRQKKEKVMRMKKDEMINEMAMKQKERMNQGKIDDTLGGTYLVQSLSLLQTQSAAPRSTGFRTELASRGCTIFKSSPWSRRKPRCPERSFGSRRGSTSGRRKRRGSNRSRHELVGGKE